MTRKNFFSVFSLKKIATRIKKNEPVICFIDDDGSTEFLTKFMPLLEKNKIKCSLAVITDDMEGKRNKINRLNWQQLLTLQENGYEIINHSQTHSRSVWDKYNIFNIKKQIHELRKSKYILSNKGYNSNVFVYPFSANNLLNCFSVLREFKYGITSKDRVIRPGVYFSAMLPRVFINFQKHNLIWYLNIIRLCKSTRGMLIFGIHSDKNEEWNEDNIEKILTYINKSKIKCMTFSEAISFKS